MTFGVIAVGASGITAAEQWMDIAAGNIANSGDASAPGSPGFRASEPVFSPIVGGGVDVALGRSPAEAPLLAYSPTSPVANSAGYVQDPDVDMAGQMVGMIEASDAVAMNVAVIDRAMDAYQSIIDLGRGSSFGD